MSMSIEEGSNTSLLVQQFLIIETHLQPSRKTQPLWYSVSLIAQMMGGRDE